MLLHSYFSIMDEIRLHAPPDGKPYEIKSAFCHFFQHFLFFSIRSQFGHFSFSFVCLHVTLFEFLSSTTHAS
jgi:hypothetical protein